MARSTRCTRVTPAGPKDRHARGFCAGGIYGSGSTPGGAGFSGGGPHAAKQEHPPARSRQPMVKAIPGSRDRQRIGRRRGSCRLSRNHHTGARHLLLGIPVSEARSSEIDPAGRVRSAGCGTRYRHCLLGVHQSFEYKLTGGIYSLLRRFFKTREITGFDCR